MLKVVAFYAFYWWFIKLENKKLIIIRAVISSVLSAFFLMAAIAMFTEPHIVKDGFAFMGIFVLVPAILLGLRAIFDAQKLSALKKTLENNNVSENKPKPQAAQTMTSINNSADFSQHLLKK